MTKSNGNSINGSSALAIPSLDHQCPILLEFLIQSKKIKKDML
jgi:hypothetical protein